MFRVAGPILNIETIANGRKIRELARLRKLYGGAGWRKRKGIVKVIFDNGNEHVAEVHWYEAHGIGRKEVKIKHIIK